MFNRICIQGNLVRTPEFANTRGDTDILNFTIASTRKYKRKEETVFVDCVAYQQTAENIAKFFDKGDPIGIEGRLCLNQWESREGEKRSKLYISVDAFHFVGQIGGRDGDNDRQSSRGGSSRRNARQGGRSGGNSRDNSNRSSSRTRQGGRNEKQEDSRYDDDIPF